MICKNMSLGEQVLPCIGKQNCVVKKGYRLKIGTFGFQLMITEEIIDK